MTVSTRAKAPEPIPVDPSGSASSRRCDSSPHSGETAYRGLLDTVRANFRASALWEQWEVQHDCFDAREGSGTDPR